MCRARMFDHGTHHVFKRIITQRRKPCAKLKPRGAGTECCCATLLNLLLCNVAHVLVIQDLHVERLGATLDSFHIRSIFEGSPISDLFRSLASPSWTANSGSRKERSIPSLFYQSSLIGNYQSPSIVGKANSGSSGCNSSIATMPTKRQRS